VKLEKTIKVGEILTIITILISVAGVFITLSKDRYMREKEQADRIRNAAAKTSAMLERWQSLNLSFFDELQPDFVETSEILSKKHDAQEARDHLWKKINSCKANIAAKILDEHIEIAYMDLCVSLPDFQKLFEISLKKLELAKKKTIDSFLRETENNVISANDLESTAVLGTVLRQTAESHQSQLINKTNEILAPVQSTLTAVIKNPNDSTVLYDLSAQFPDLEKLPKSIDKAKNPF
jgi:hypothetical protein